MRDRWYEWGVLRTGSVGSPFIVVMFFDRLSRFWSVWLQHDRLRRSVFVYWTGNKKGGVFFFLRFWAVLWMVCSKISPFFLFDILSI
jgi:hypothetical protein